MAQQGDLEKVYRKRYDEHLCRIAKDLEGHLMDNVGSCERIDRISARAKSVDRFCKKAERQENGQRKYSDPLNQIQDQLGARIVTFYLSDLDKVSRLVEGYYAPIERHNIVPDSEKEFGYEGRHYILFVPDDILPEKNRGQYPKFFELQIKTLFQHAWAEAEHDLAYKPSHVLSSDEKRRIAFTAAQAWGADIVFDELFQSSREARSHRG